MYDFIVEPAYGEQNPFVTTSFRLCVCVRPSGLVRALTSTYMHDFQIIWHSCSPSAVEVSFESIVQVG